MIRRACVFTALLLVASRAEEAGASEGYSDENLGDANSQFEGDDAPKKPTTHPDVKASFVFPDFAKPRFPMGEPVDMLVAFSNSGNKLFNVTELGGTLNSPYNFRFIVQNFTHNAGVMALKPGEQRSAIFTFTPDGRLEALDFQLHLFAKYEDAEGEKFTQVLFNETATLVESASETSSKIFFMIKLLAVAAGLAGIKIYAAYDKYDKKMKKKANRAEAEALAKQPVMSEEWLVGLPGVKSKKEKAPKSGGSDKPRSKSKKAT